MKFTLSWLKDHLKTTATLDEICTCLNAIGLEVEEIVNYGDIFKDFSVAEIMTAQKHPDADKLRVCQVKTSSGMQEIVCGAPNARVGIKVVYASIGTAIPGILDDHGNPIILKKAKIRGVESCGMMLSIRELGLGEDHDGIVELPQNAKIGDNIASWLGLNDPIIEIAITPNRGDWLGVRGIARELQAAGLGKLKPLAYDKPTSGFASPVTVNYGDEQAKVACPVFLGRYIKNVQNKPSPAWMQQRLKAIGLRPISALVDITNYITYDLCRPAHFFDADKIQGNLSLRMGKSGEKLLALNEKEYAIDESMIVIAAENGVESIGAIMGGLKTGCTEGTKNLFIEIAIFDRENIAYTGRKLGLQSDARYRFERGVDSAFIVEAMDIATAMVLDICGGEASDVVTCGKSPEHHVITNFDPKRVKNLAGIDIDDVRQKQILTDLGYKINDQQTPWQVREPSWRHDCEGEAGIVEEVIRINLLDNIAFESLPPLSSVAAASQTSIMRAKERARRHLAEQGLFETITFSFMDSNKAKMFASLSDDLYVDNPVASDLNYMRPTILANLLDGIAYNHNRGLGDAHLFEIGPIFHGTGDDQQPDVIAAALAGVTHEKHWSEKPRIVDVFDAKALATSTLQMLDAPAASMRLERKAPEYYHPGRSGQFTLGPKNTLAYFGEIHPKILQAFAIKSSVVALEIFPQNIPRAKNKRINIQPYTPSDMMPMPKDFAFVVPKDFEADTLRRAALNADKKRITSATIFDVFEGGNLDENEKSVAINVVIQPQQTLSDKDLEVIYQNIIQNVEKTGAKLRS